ncbi:flagellar hook-length control protein FliK [Thermogutta sp.]|uniref:flagellar hook-length control protein FliK n=1 Tax=Thermogutta sp. TaxID=1962930 RepID=UPI00321F72B5
MATGIDNPDILAVLGPTGSPRDYAGSEIGAKPAGSSFQDVLNQQAVKQSEESTANRGMEATEGKGVTTGKPSSSDRGFAERPGQADPGMSQVEQKDEAFKKESPSGQSEKTHSTRGNRVSSSQANEKVILEREDGETRTKAGEENREEKGFRLQCGVCGGQLPNMPQVTTDSAVVDFSVVEDVGENGGHGELALLGEDVKAQRAGQVRPKTVGSDRKTTPALSAELEGNESKTARQEGERQSSWTLSLDDKFTVNNTTEKILDTASATINHTNKKARSTAASDRGQDPGQPRTIIAEADSPAAAKPAAVSGLESKVIDGIKTGEIVRKDSETRDAGERVTALTNEAGETARMKGHPASTPSLEQSSNPEREPLHLSQHDRVELVQRVFHAVRLARLRDGELRLRLHPPELGALRVELRVEGGALIARLEAESPAARDLLIDNLADLRQRLAEHRVRIERFDVTLMSQSDSGGGQHHTASFHIPRPSGMRWGGQERAVADEQDYSPQGTRTLNSLFDVIA